MSKVANKSEGVPHDRKEAHERKDGPWDDWELDEGARHIEHAEKIRGNKKFGEAIAKHMEERAAEHHKMAEHARHLAKSGRLSDKAVERMSKS